MGLKKALLVGRNYPGTGEQLNGCVNDVMKMRVCLVERFGFAEEDTTVLVDTDEQFTPPVGVSVRPALMDLVSSVAPDEVLVFHFSTRIAVEDDANDETGYDECIYLTDEDLINDDYFRALVNMVPIGCRITIITDSCHSGGMIERAKEQIGNSTEGGDEEASQEEACVKIRSIPFSTLIKNLKEKTGKVEISRQVLGSLLAYLFGEDSSQKIQELVQQLREQREEGSEEREEFNAEDGKRGLPAGGVLISGCQSDQLSVDANPTGDPADAYGALSNAIPEVLEVTEGEISNRDLAEGIRQWMVEHGFV